MPSEIQIPHTTGSTLYAVLIDGAGQAWNGAAFVAIAALNWSAYAVALVEADGTGLYLGDFPVVAAGTYGVTAYRLAGGAPAITDPVVGGGEIRWTGTAVQPVQTGDSFARIGLAGAGLTELGDTRIANLDAAVSSRSTAAQVNSEVAVALAAFGVATQAGVDARTLPPASYATQALLNVVAGYVDTEVAAILAVATKLDSALELSGGSYRYTAAALALAPTGGSAPTVAQIVAGIRAIQPTPRDVTAVTSPTFDDCLIAAWAGAAARETVVGTAYTVYQPDGVSVLRLFTLDSATEPTART